MIDFKNGRTIVIFGGLSLAIFSLLGGIVSGLHVYSILKPVEVTFTESQINALFFFKASLLGVSLYFIFVIVGVMLGLFVKDKVINLITLGLTVIGILFVLYITHRTYSYFWVDEDTVKAEAYSLLAEYHSVLAAYITCAAYIAFFQVYTFFAPREEK